MLRFGWLSRVVVSFMLAGLPQLALAHDSPVGTVQNFGPNLQSAAGGVCRQPEGLAIDPAGNLYAASNSDSATIGHICVVDPAGVLKDVIVIPTGTSPVIGLLGELWENGSLYVLDQADNVVPNGRLLKVDPRTHAVTTIANGFAFPNSLVEDRRGNLYVSDSFLGAIYKVAAGSSTPTLWFKSKRLLSNNPNQPVGANDMAFDASDRFLYIDNTGNRQLFRIPLEQDGTAGSMQRFVDGQSIDRQQRLGGPVALFGADGIQFDVLGNLYVLANQANEIQVYDPDGELIHRYAGSGLNALDFPASLVFRGRDLFLTNMSAADGGLNSKLSEFEAPAPGLPLR